MQFFPKVFFLKVAFKIDSQDIFSSFPIVKLSLFLGFIILVEYKE